MADGPPRQDFTPSSAGGVSTKHTSASVRQLSRQAHTQWQAAEATRLASIEEDFQERLQSRKDDEEARTAGRAAKRQKKKQKEKASKDLVCIGLMSGTSMDGVDVALLRTDGRGRVATGECLALPYAMEEVRALRAAEATVRGEKGCTASVADAIALSTRLHEAAVRAILTKSGLSPADVDVIGYHGQTVYHRPSEGITVQLGDGIGLSKALGITVACDFRIRDVRGGGQGAPLAPIYHLALARRGGVLPCVVINCGGIANITVLTEGGEEGALVALDTGPGNCLVDALVRSRTDGAELMDTDGRYGLKGKVDLGTLRMLWDVSLSRPYYALPPPRSLDTGDFELAAVLTLVAPMPLPDACRTLEAFTAATVTDAVVGVCRVKGIDVPTTWILAGGGWRNPCITEELRLRAPPSVVIVEAETVGWSGQFLEAELMGYLAARAVKGLPLGFPGTTGVRDPATTGATLHNV